MKRTIACILLGSVLVISSCSLRQQYVRPEAPVPAEWPSGAAYSPKLGDDAAAMASKLSWDAFFPDECLQWLIQVSLNNNRDLRLAALNVEKARALYGIQRAELYPSLGATGNIDMQRVPADLSSSHTATTQKQYSVNLGISSWEIDFFGRIRSLKDQALETYLASEETRNSAQISLISTVAGAYLTLVADKEALSIAQSTLATQQASYQLILKRLQAGVGTDIDLQRAKTQVDSAQADIWRFTQQIAKDLNALNLVVGKPVDEELLAKDLAGIRPLQPISPGLSSEVLLLRPDIRAAEHRLLAANAQIDAARAALFPRISLTTAIGTASADLGGLFGSGQGTWLFAPQISAPIFDARLWSAYDAARIEGELAIAQYEKAIQSAFREVADALAIRGTIDRQIEIQQSLFQSASRTYELANQRYAQGVDSYLGVLDAQRAMYSAQQGLVQLHLAKLANQVQLYAVLGGGAA